MKPTYQVKTFFGNMMRPVDEEMNKWFAEHPEVYVEEFKYTAGTDGRHSACIMYSENYKGERL